MKVPFRSDNSSSFRASQPNDPASVIYAREMEEQLIHKFIKEARLNMKGKRGQLQQGVEDDSGSVEVEKRESAGDEQRWWRQGSPTRWT